jgi:hypothetical protein
MENKWEIRYREGIFEDLSAIIKKHPDLKGIIIQRLEALEKYPPKKWFDVREQNGSSVFKLGNQIIQMTGEADSVTRTVWIHKVSVGRN